MIAQRGYFTARRHPRARQHGSRAPDMCGGNAPDHRRTAYRGGLAGHHIGAAADDHHAAGHHKNIFCDLMTFFGH